MKQVAGIEIAGVCDLNQERRSRAVERIGVRPETVFASADEMMRRTGPVDLISVATTAPFHVEVARMCMPHTKRILIEKPLDTSLTKARDFHRDLSGGGYMVAVNYSRRWLLDFQAIRRCIEQGAIGDVRSMAIVIGKGELAMHASHYFDLCRFMLRSDPASVISRLEPIRDPNARGSEYQDPSGFAMMQFHNGARAYIDFSSDLERKDPSILIKGTHGTIGIDEQQLVWILTSLSRRSWTVPFAGPMSSAIMFRRVLVQSLTEPVAKSTFEDGLKALEMIYGAHLSSSRSGEPISLPLPNNQPDLKVRFP
jgi:predicted dehydrogenase